MIKHTTRVASKSIWTRRVWLSSLRVSLGVFLLTGAMGCASKVLRVDQSNELLKNDEFEQQINVAELPAAEQTQVTGLYVRLPGPPPVPEALEKVVQDMKEMRKAAREAKYKPKGGSRNSGKPLVGRMAPKNDSKAAPIFAETEPPKAKPAARDPAIEDAEGFNGRRPIKDPYRVGEKVTLELSYFTVVAGDMTLEVRPFVHVNGRKSYQFVGTAKSTSVFAMFYAVDDWFETYVDYESMTPSSYALHVKESKQLRESRMIINQSEGIANFWDKRINAEKKVEEKKYEWPVPAFSQNVFTAAYYLRAFTLTPGKSLAFRVAHENENLVMTGEVLRREKLSTPAGQFNTIVLKPKIELNGVFKPVGDIFIWLTDDDRKLIVKIESKIKIGKIVAVAKSIELGQP